MARRSGKTTLLINAAYTTGYPIIVKDSARAKAVKDQAESLGLDIKVFSYLDWINSHYHDNKILIDEATELIEGALTGLLRAEVVACTFTIPMTEIKNKEVEK
jgi:hypothetical protein